jgi:hypothetical protein
MPDKHRIDLGRVEIKVPISKEAQQPAEPTETSEGESDDRR